MKLEPVAWALYWQEGDMCRVTHDEQDAVDWLTMAMNEKETPVVAPLYAIPEGYVVVPKEPTPKMMVAGFLASEAPHDPAGVYRAMIAAGE